MPPIFPKHNCLMAYLGTTSQLFSVAVSYSMVTQKTPCANQRGRAALHQEIYW
jgi:hypothetical protein